MTAMSAQHGTAQHKKLMPRSQGVYSMSDGMSKQRSQSRSQRVYSNGGEYQLILQVGKKTFFAVPRMLQASCAEKAAHGLMTSQEFNNAADRGEWRVAQRMVLTAD